VLTALDAERGMALLRANMASAEAEDAGPTE
jgi:hypothetical protein